MRTYLGVCLALTSVPVRGGWDAIGPFGGSAAIIQVDRHHRGAVLAATSNAQLFRSDNDGTSWRSLLFPAESRATLHAFVVDHQTPGVFLVGLSSVTPEYSGVFRTRDGGLTWQRLASPGLKEVWSIAIWPRDSRVIAAGTLEGVLITHDGGDNWEHVGATGNPEPKPVVSLGFDTLDSNVLYAGTPHLAWKTVDGGVTWHSIYKGMLDDSDVFSILIDNRHRQKLFAGACGGAYRSLDGGEAWTKLPGAKGASSRTYQIVQHPLRPTILLAATASGLVKSMDGGTTWRRLTAQSTRWIAFDPARPDRIFIATDDEGLFRSDDLGESLQMVNRGFSNRRLNSIAALGNTIYAGLDSTSSSVLRRKEPDEAWEPVPPPQLGQGKPVKVVSSDTGLLYLVTVDGLAVSSGASQSWSAIPAPSTEARLMDLLFASRDGNTLLVDTEGGVYRTDDAGLTWSATEFPDLSQERSRIYGIVMTEDDELLAATSRGLMRSDDRGVTWGPVSGVLGVSTVRALCIHPRQAGILFASQYGAIFGSKDGGRSWTRISDSEQGGGAVSALLVVPGTPDRLLVLTESRGVYTIPLGSE